MRRVRDGRERETEERERCRKAGRVRWRAREKVRER